MKVEVGVGVGVGEGKLKAFALTFVTNPIRYISQPTGKVIVLTICPEGVTSISTAPVSLKFHGWFSTNWCELGPKSPIQSPFGSISTAPKNVE